MIFAITRLRCGEWDFGKPMQEQPGWPAHAAYMDRHHEAGDMPLAGPIGDGRKVLIVVRANDIANVEQLLASDPWSTSGLLVTESIEPWDLRLGSLA